MATIPGTGGNDTENDLVGSSDLYDMLAGADTVYAGGGNDTLLGGAGNDRLFGGNDNDSLDGGADRDSLEGGEGNDTLIGGAERDTILGGNGNDYIFENDFANNGNDLIDGGGGIDTVDFTGANGGINMTLNNGNATVDPGGTNNTDTLVGIENIVGTGFNDTIIGDTANNVLSGGGGADSLRGGVGDDTVSGDAGDDIVRGDDGNDLLYGGLGIDRLRGGNQNDTLIGGEGADSIEGDAGTDTASYVTSAAGVAVTINGSSNTGGDAQGDILINIENLTGSSYNDTLTGSAGDNVIDGGDGNDLIAGGAGNDTLVGGLGTDTVDFSNLATSVTVNLTTNVATGDGTDSLNGIENAIGGGGNDTLVGSAEDNVLSGNAGNDSISAEAGDDTVNGGIGNDTIDGGTGDDVLNGAPQSPEESYVPLDFNWSAVGADGTDITNINQDTGGINVNVVLTTPGDNFNLFDVETAQDVFVADGEPFNPASSGELRRDGDGAATVVDINFSAVPGSGLEGEVENVEFRISDVDDQGWRDRITVRAWDADGNEITVVMTDNTGDLTTSGGSVEAVNGAGNTTAAGEDGSVLVTIQGPVARIEITYDNLETDAQVIYVSDIHFDAVATADDDSITGGDGNDTITGGIGADTLFGAADNDALFGGDGVDSIDGGDDNDTIHGGAGDNSLYGGQGNDVFVILDGDVDTLAGNKSIFGGGGPGIAPGDFDTLDLSDYGWSRVEVVRDAPGSEDGYVIIYEADGVTEIGRIDFENIEKVIPCFTPGTLIQTDRGAVAVETLVPGDMVLTRDHGMQPLRWIGQRALSYLDLLAEPDLQPVRIGQGAIDGIGPDRTMLVSPQHRVLFEGASTELLFGEVEVLVAAKHLVGKAEVTRALPSEGVTYVHILFDQHEIVMSDGLWTESFQPAERMLSAMEAEVRAEVLALFPALAGDIDAYASARMSLKAHEARVLLAH